MDVGAEKKSEVQETPLTPPGADAKEAERPGEEAKPDEHLFDEGYVKQLRQEAAKWRVKVRELETALTNLQDARTQQEESELAEQAKWKELAEKREREVADLRKQVKEREAALMRAKIAAEYNLLGTVLDESTGETLADRLRGETEEELRADAAKLAKLAARAQPATPAQAEGATAPSETALPGARGPQTTTAVPGGRPAGRTDTDRRREYFTFNNDSPFYRGGGLVLPSEKSGQE